MNRKGNGLDMDIPNVGLESLKKDKVSESFRMFVRCRRTASAAALVDLLRDIRGLVLYAAKPFSHVFIQLHLPRMVASSILHAR